MATAGGPAPEEAAPSAPRLATWLDAYEEALASSHFDEAAVMLEEQVLTLLGRGDQETVAALIARLPPAARTPLLRAADADVATRAHTIDLASLDALERRVQSTIDLRAFVVAVKAQHLLWRGDPLCFSVAQSGLDLLPHEGLVTPVGLFARGRLRLVLAIGTLFVSFAARTNAEELLDGAVADFMRAGAVAEAAAAQAYVHGLIAAVTWTDVADAAETVGAAAARLQSRHSPYAPFALVSEALLRFIAGDMWSCHRVLESYDAWVGPRPDFVPYIADYIRLLARLLGDGGAGPSFDGDAVRIVDGLDRHAPELAGTMTLTIGGILADIGDYTRARQWAARARQAPQPLPSDPLGRQLLDARLRLALRRADEVDDVITSGLDPVAGMRDAGYGRAADIALARLARSLREAGDHARADELRAAAADALRPVQTIWETVLLGPEVASPPRSDVVDLNEPSVRIIALAPDIHVELDGRAVPLGKLHARIVGYLLAAGRPCTLDEILDAIWPDVETAAARHRLAMALHRLRTALGDADLVQRDNAGLRLAPCSSDVADLLGVDADDTEAATAAVLGYGADFGERQLAYDEWAIDARRWLRARFASCAMKVLERDAVAAVDVALHARRAAADDPALADAIVHTLVRAGRDAEAAAIRDVIARM